MAAELTSVTLVKAQLGITADDIPTNAPAGFMRTQRIWPLKHAQRKSSLRTMRAVA